MENQEHVHNYGEMIVEKAICGKRQQLYRKCSICGAIEVIGVQGNVVKHLFADQKIIQEATCVQKGLMQYTCTRCGYSKEVQLPISDHHYVKNNPFYEVCRNCEKKALTPFAKRIFCIAGTAALAGEIYFAMLPFFSNKAVIETSLSETKFEETTYIKPSVSETDITEATASTSYETEYSETACSEITTLPVEIQTLETMLHETKMPETAPLEPSAVESTIVVVMSTENNTTETTIATVMSTESSTSETTIATVMSTENSTSESTIAAVMSTESSTSEMALAATIPAESSAAENTLPVETVDETSSEDYIWLTGEILNGSDILELIEKGAPIELITNTGTRFCANVSISDAYPLFDTELIPKSASYTVNVILLDRQQVIVCNQF